MSGSGWTMDSKVSCVTLRTSETFSASVSAATRDARATAEAKEEKRIVEGRGRVSGESKVIMTAFYRQDHAYVSIHHRLDQPIKLLDDTTKLYPTLLSNVPSNIREIKVRATLAASTVVFHLWGKLSRWWKVRDGESMRPRIRRW